MKPITEPLFVSYQILGLDKHRIYPSKSTGMTYSEISNLLGREAKNLLGFTSQTLPSSTLHLPGPDFLNRVWEQSDRSPQVLRSLGQLFNHGRLAGTGYLSILLGDQGVEHWAGDSFAANPQYFDPEHFVRLGLEGGCNAVATTFGILGMVARRFAHRIPFIVKLNHDELLSYPNHSDQVRFGSVKQAWNLGAMAVAATIHFGAAESKRHILEVSAAFEEAHSLGMVTVLWCYLRNEAFDWGKKKNFHYAADLTGQANHLGVTLQADLIIQRLPDLNGGLKILTKSEDAFGRVDERMYSQLVSDHPIDLCRYQVANSYMGRCGLVNVDDCPEESTHLRKSVRTAVVNKRAGGMGVISGRKVLHRPFAEGVKLLESIQDVYLEQTISIA